MRLNEYKKIKIQISMNANKYLSDYIKNKSITPAFNDIFQL